MSKVKSTFRNLQAWTFFPIVHACVKTAYELFELGERWWFVESDCTLALSEDSLREHIEKCGSKNHDEYRRENAENQRKQNQL